VLESLVYSLVLIAELALVCQLFESAVIAQGLLAVAAAVRLVAVGPAVEPTVAGHDVEDCRRQIDEPVLAFLI